MILKNEKRNKENADEALVKQTKFIGKKRT